MKYLVITRRTPAFRSDILPEHYAFLEGLRGAGLLECAGPFMDRSGGAYVLSAAGFDQARLLALSDPLHVAGCSTCEVFEWDAT